MADKIRGALGVGGERFEPQRLESPSQLPEITGDEIVIIWDVAEPEEYIYFKHGDSVLFKEPAFFGNAARYTEVAAIFHRRYGSRLKDIVPTSQGWRYLGGENGGRLHTAEAAREAFFPAGKAQAAVVDRRLSTEQWADVSREVRRWQEGGFSQRDLQDSMLGLDWSRFSSREYPEGGGHVTFKSPPEFIYYGFSILDAYATAVLAANIARKHLGVLHFLCELEPGVGNSGMQLDLVTVPERGSILRGTAMLELLNSLPDLLRAKGLEECALYYLEGEGCPMRLDYPGRMVASVSPYLCQRPLDMWPVVSLSIAVTEELELRAKTVVEFSRDTASDGSLN